MFENFLTKENIALVGVVALFLWRVIDFFIRQKKKRESELEKLAFEMAKYHCSTSTHLYQKESFFSYYLFYLDALENNMRPYGKKGYEIMEDFENQLTKKVENLEDLLQKINILDEKLENKHEITATDLWDRNLDWSMWWRETRKILRKSLKRKRKFHSLKQ